MFGSDRNILQYVLSCGSQLPAILAGRLSPLETLFPGGSFTVAESIYEHASLPAYYNTLARSIFDAIVRARGNAPLKVIEIGAGTGATTSSLAPVLPPKSAYFFTDISDVFLHHGRSRFAALAQMRFAIFNVETGEANG